MRRKTRILTAANIVGSAIAFAHFYANNHSVGRGYLRLRHRKMQAPAALEGQARTPSVGGVANSRSWTESLDWNRIDVSIIPNFGWCLFLITRLNRF
jgi:hypothetical protein